jgi:hypothetical protein
MGMLDSKLDVVCPFLTLQPQRRALVPNLPTDGTGLEGADVGGVVLDGAGLGVTTGDGAGAPEGAFVGAGATVLTLVGGTAAVVGRGVERGAGAGAA